MLHANRLTPTLLVSLILGGLLVGTTRNTVVPVMNSSIHLVSNADDDGPGSLRYAIFEASSGDTIAFDATVFNVPLTITLESQLEISIDLTISGGGTSVITPTISGNQMTRVFDVGGGQVTLNRLNIVNGNSGPEIGSLGGGIYNTGTLTVTHSTFMNNKTLYGGGGIYNDGQLSVVDSTLVGNAATGSSSGGGISNAGTLAVIDSMFISNTAHYDGGGIINWGGTLNIISSTLSGNSATYGSGIDHEGGILTVTNSTLSGNKGDYGGGIGSWGTLTVMNSTLSDNSALYDGGAIFAVASGLRVINSTLSGNQAGDDGGAIWSDGTLTVTNSTVADNSAASIGGIYILNSGTAFLKNTIIARNVFYNCYAYDGNSTFIDGGFNLEDKNTCEFLATSSFTQTDPRIGPLQNNGGSTWTHALLRGSPAVNAGDPAFTPPPFYDQRGPGFPRVIGGIVDIGAYEDRWSVFLPLIER